MKKYLFTFPIIALVPKVVSAHCPLCTVGAGALAVLAASLGLSSGIVGILIGAFATVLSIYLAKIVKKKYFNGQNILIIIVVYLSTVIPIAPLVREFAPFYISLMGDYGAILHNTYTINLYLYGVIVGTLAVIATPYLSNLITRIRSGRKINYQRMITMFALLVVVSVITQIIFK